MPAQTSEVTIYMEECRKVLYTGKRRSTKSLSFPQLVSKLLRYIAMERVFQPLFWTRALAWDNARGPNETE